MKKIYAHFVCMIIILGSLTISAMETNILRENCKNGCFFAGEGENFKKEFDTHNQNSRKIILELINGMKNGGTVVVLGPGIGSDLPLKELFIKFDKTILIDGYTDLLENSIAKLPVELQKKVQILNEDLTGGFFAFLEKDRQNLKRAIAKDYLDFVAQGNGNFLNLRELINTKSLRLDLKQHAPTLVISSIVTSQILRLPSSYLSPLLEEMIFDTNDRLLHEFSQTMKYHGNTFSSWSYDLMRTYWQAALTPYFKGIADSTAEKIYHSVDIKNIKNSDLILNSEEFEIVKKEKEEFARFNNFMAPKYSISISHDNAWSYKGNLLVSWQIWHQKPLHDASQVIAAKQCNTCRKTNDLKRCKGCQKTWYCGQLCQKADWAEHKGSCTK